MKVTDKEVIDAVRIHGSLRSCAKYLNIYPSSLKKRMDKLGIEFSEYNKIKRMREIHEIKSEASRKYKINHYCFDELNEDTAYWLGFFAADASVDWD